MPCCTCTLLLRAMPGRALLLLGSTIDSDHAPCNDSDCVSEYDSDHLQQIILTSHTMTSWYRLVWLTSHTITSGSRPSPTDDAQQSRATKMTPQR